MLTSKTPPSVLSIALGLCLAAWAPSGSWAAGVRIGTGSTPQSGNMGGNKSYLAQMMPSEGRPVVATLSISKLTGIVLSATGMQPFRGSMADIG